MGNAGYRVACSLAWGNQVNTISNLLPQYLAFRESDKLTAMNTFRNIRSSLNRYALGNTSHLRIDNTALESITPDVILRWLDSIQGGTATKLACLARLSGFFTWCCKHLEVVGKNPCQAYTIQRQVKLWRRTAKAVDMKTTFTREQIGELIAIDGVRGIRYMTAICTGMRDQELAALTWKDLNWLSNELTVRHSLLRGGKSPALHIDDLDKTYIVGQADGKAVFGETKNHRERKIPVHGLLAKALNRWYGEWILYTGSCPNADDPIFPNAVGNFTTHGAVEKLHADLKELGYTAEAFNYHSFRHTFGTWLADNGYSVGLIGRLLGHSRGGVTGDYIHFGKAVLLDAIENSIHWEEV